MCEEYWRCCLVHSAQVFNRAGESGGEGEAFQVDSIDPVRQIPKIGYRHSSAPPMTFDPVWRGLFININIPSALICGKPTGLVEILKLLCLESCDMR